MAPEVIIAELSKSKARIDNIWAVLMTFFTILNPDQYYPFQNGSKNIPNKITSNMKTVFKQKLQKLTFL